MSDTDKLARPGGRITKSALRRSWFIWEMFPQTCYNYERMMGQAVAHVFAPIARMIHPEDAEARLEMMRRESEFFNVHIEFGSCILGMAIAMEEEKAQGAPIPGEFITNIKTSLMGSLAGVGDTIWQGVVIPILLGICIDLTGMGGGNIWGALMYAALIIAGALTLSYANFMFGYRAGSEAVVDFLEKGTLNKILKGASIMGCMVMGGLIVNYVHVTCGIEFMSAGTSFNLQTGLFDTVMPKMLPLAATMLIYALLKRRWSSLKIIALIVVLGIIGGLTGVLAFPA
ncbi:PTS system mannose/fructose/sorbose family transporter subunit IID [Collinsella sp. AGMB00827]|uniref:PTS system mannose/fructose/sorbose family transporter subunit IID n=1 Tax=Collinsella ureilytica TaxID=2869515 RepID=A0ABS7MLY4_9ACTN|nr:PTS system mannose/fructose/sorbose family transporter subunit IID [Collinsella urealyticum]MBY4798376.1 PTS system mannose/fructose/sorbose family transporter subunit IID [Collinsella urealyticum]